MPFDSKDFAETKPDVFSLESLITWLEQQPAAESYDYWAKICNGGCLLHCYLIDKGKDPATDYDAIATCFGDPNMRRIGAYVAQDQPWTYGAALKRARKLLAERS